MRSLTARPRGGRLLASGLELPLDGPASLGLRAGAWCGFELDVAEHPAPFDDLDEDGRLEGAWVGDDGSHPPPPDGTGGPPRR